MQLGVVQNCHRFHKSTQSTLGEGVNDRCTLLTNVDYNALHFRTGSLKINTFKVRECGRGSQKEYSVYAFDNVDNSGRPLSKAVYFPNVTMCHQPSGKMEFFEIYV